MKLKIGSSFLPIPHLLADIVTILVAVYASLWLRLGSDLGRHVVSLNNFALLFVATRVSVLFMFHVYSGMWRYTSIRDATAIVKSIGISELLFFAITYLAPNLGYLPRSFFFIDAVLSMSLLIGIRVFRRSLFEQYQLPKSANYQFRKALVVGAGNNGRSLVQILSKNGQAGIEVVGFIDDDESKQNRRIQGVHVLGRTKDIGRLLESTRAQEVILAITNPTGELLRKVVEECRQFNIRPQIISQFGLRVKRGQREELYREINISDLLNRQVAEIDYSAVSKLLNGKVVLITGAGGSIGSELARQISRLGPSRLLILDHSEVNLYNIDQELRLSTTDIDRVVPLLADLKDKNSLSRIFERYRPDWVFHAAAYKHVHLVEVNPFSAILNNIGGTQNILELSLSADIEGFVQISTDKAVNPVGVMGATKRICELMVSLAGRSSKKCFCSVRFGNVIGSSGSLIPLLQNQIKEGGPVTITHEDMTRYFMLIPEAVSLVLMSATIAKPGDINVLKMGEPVKVLDIARSLLTFMGKTEEEVPILFTGLRPGEKMFEELYLSGKEIETIHPDILTLPDGDLGSTSSIESELLFSQVDDIIESAEAGKPDAFSSLNKLTKGNLEKLDNYYLSPASPHKLH